MKTIGMIGGMSWESSSFYYLYINEEIRARLGGLNSAEILMRSVNFEPVAELQRQGAWQRAGELLADHAAVLETGGADFLLLCTNTMHKVADRITARVSIPLLHIAHGTGEAIRNAGLGKVALLGTRFTMEEDFYADYLREHFDIEVVVPEDSDRAEVHRVIYEELTLGRIEADSRSSYLAVIEKLCGKGAEAVILGCTEIGMLISSEDLQIPVFDTTRIHAIRAVEEALC